MNLSMEDIERIAEQCGVEIINIDDATEEQIEEQREWLAEYRKKIDKMDTKHNPYCIQCGRLDICQGSISKCIRCSHNNNETKD